MTLELGGGGLGSSGLDVDVNAQNGDLGVGGLEDKVYLHGLAGAVVEVLAGQMEVELRKLERLVAAGNHEAAAFADNLYGGAEVLEGRARREVGDVNGELGACQLSEGAIHQVNGRLRGACGAGHVGRGVQGVPVGRALASC